MPRYGMFTELPKLFERDFVVGFFLPAAVLIGSVWVVFRTFGIVGATPSAEILASTAITVGVVWFVWVLLMALNRAVWGLLEGNPRRLFEWRERRWKARFRKDTEAVL